MDKVDQTERFQGRLTKARRQAMRSFRQYAEGFHPRHCDLCGYYGMFAPFGNPPRIDAKCVCCWSLERHRMVGLLLDRENLITKDHKVLHFAPERQLKGKISTLAGEYITADLSRPKVDLNLNLENLELLDESFDRIVCNQVLEHVPNDKKAYAEIYRVLKPGGIALLNTPVIEGWDKTYENDNVKSPEDRLLYFGQDDHVRFFGRDIRDRIKAAGFELREFVAEEPDVSKYGLWRGERIFIATKPVKKTTKKTATKTKSKK